MLKAIVSFLCILSLLLCLGCDGGCGTGEETDMDGDGFAPIDGDCNDTDAAVHPFAPEVCNGIDDNCNDQIDEGCQWNKTFGGTDDEWATSVISGNNGGYVIAGTVHNNDPGEMANAWIIKINEKGNKQWHQTFGGTDEDYAESVISGNTGGYVIAGATKSYGTRDSNGRTTSDAWIIKTNEYGNTPASFRIAVSK